MLALAYAAAYPHDVTCLALIGCGTFDEASRNRLQAARGDRTAGAVQQALDAMLAHLPDPDERLREMGNMLLRAYSVDPVVQSLDLEACDAAAYEQTWSDMIRLQEDRTYPAAFEAIHCPAIMLHGAADPHPGRMTWETLTPHIPHLEYREWERCGHYPWLEGSVREEFVMVLRLWLERQAAAASSGTP
jgi:pimeloyl-ACP methyl ester carboxylesterase